MHDVGVTPFGHHPHSPAAMTLYQIKCESRWDPGRNLPDESGIGKRRGPLIPPDGGGIPSLLQSFWVAQSHDEFGAGINCSLKWGVPPSPLIP